ncbi:GNAT family N-acetyltransferase [Methanolobus sp. ZRKC3]|uniref:GNAT family N-acetyltransferase n=1 Tax=Methanolobus sp. ZRKC3 TaxID=3125786 RepID=UPI0032518C1F
MGWVNKLKNVGITKIIDISENIGHLQIKGKESSLSNVGPQEFIIRTADSEKDIKKALQIHGHSSDTPPPEERIYKLYRKFGKYTFLIAENDKKVIGYSFFKITPSISKNRISKKAFLVLLGTHPEHRNKGIATILLRTSLQIFEEWGVNKVYLNVEKNNRCAIALYNKIGFEPVERTNERSCLRLEYWIDNV